MANKKEETVESTEPVSSDDVKTSSAPDAVAEVAGGAVGDLRSPLKSPYFWSIIVAAVVLALIIAAVIVGVVAHQRAAQNTITPGYNGLTSRWESPGRVGGGRGSYWKISSSTSGPTTSTTVTTYTSTSGVVTNVSDSSLTIAGNGASEKVKTTSSTQYDNGQPKVNDSVTVIGTSDSNGTITATQVQVENY